VHVTARISALVFGLAVVWPRASYAQSVTKEQCISAYTDAQHDRQSGNLSRARVELRICASDPCPPVLQGDCSTWLGEVEGLVPTVVFAVRDTSGRDLLDVAVTVDGRPLASRADGRPVEVDPGEHVLRFVAPDHEPAEQRILFREGEKARSMSVTLKPVAPHVAPGTGADTGEGALGRSRPVPLSTWIFGGIGGAAFATAATTALIGLPRWSRCHDGGCSASDKNVSDSLNTVGDIAIAVGTVSLAAALYFFLTRPSVAIEAP
jgi:hypothetical protein